MPGEISQSYPGPRDGSSLVPPWCEFLFKVRYDHTVPNGYVHHVTEYVGARDEAGAVDELRRSIPYGRMDWKLDVLEVKKLGPYDLLTEYCGTCERHTSEVGPLNNDWPSGTCGACFRVAHQTEAT